MRCQIAHMKGRSFGMTRWEPPPRWLTAEEAMNVGPLWTAVLTCRDCGRELNRAEHVPDEEKSRVAFGSAFAAGPCPNGCRETFSDLNINTDLSWIAEDKA